MRIVLQAVSLVAPAQPMVHLNNRILWKIWVHRRKKEQKKHANKFALLLQLFQISPLVKKKRFLFPHLAKPGKK